MLESSSDASRASAPNELSSILGLKISKHFLACNIASGLDQAAVRPLIASPSLFQLRSSCILERHDVTPVASSTILSIALSFSYSFVASGILSQIRSEMRINNAKAT